ncbi:uncharacterized protein LOC141900874 [Tubulanus polymorphus]|uniref:uncharacterized protein LOC141900874 n=1 Tax=Tubulanus polymorphus TaxID=672921 RepID=UPI003DA4F7DB
MAASTKIHPMTSSISSLNSSDLEIILKDLVKQQRRGLCRADALTDSGKRKQTFKMLSLTLTPILILTCIIIYSLHQNVIERNELQETRAAIDLIEDFGRLLHDLQRERDQTALFISAIGPNTINALYNLWNTTDKRLRITSDWLNNKVLTEDRPEFKSKSSFGRYLEKHRREVKTRDETGESSVFSELDFYTSLIDVIFGWLRKTIIKYGGTTFWKTMVAYQKLSACQQDAGLKRAMGSIFYIRGGFKSFTNYTYYMKAHHGVIVYFRRAENFSNLVRALVDSNNETVQILRARIDLLQEPILYRNVTNTSNSLGSTWYGLMTQYIEHIVDQRRDLAFQLQTLIDEDTSAADGQLALSSLMMLVALLITPIMSKLVVKVVNDMQKYAITLADKTKELRQEKRRTDSLLYEMLPKVVAETLKRKKDVDAEYFKDVSIMFAGIVEFDKIAGKLSPIQTVELLGNIYTLLDGCVSKYNAYKVETVGSKYMVASGIPMINPKNALEIAEMAIEMNALSESFTSPIGKVWIQIGVNSGPCVAGVVGTTLPRYCLFGDTVNTASRMESFGLPNRIHISAKTQRTLKKANKFKMISRGTLTIKGKGVMTTYWLLGYKTEETCVMKSIQNVLTSRGEPPLDALNPEQAEVPLASTSARTIFDDLGVKYFPNTEIAEVN